MGKKQYYVYTELSLNSTTNRMVEYTPTKAEAEKVLKQVKKAPKEGYFDCYIDFVSLSDLHLPFSKLHGKNITEVNSIMDEINKVYCPTCRKLVIPDITEYEEGPEIFEQGKICPECEEYL